MLVTVNQTGTVAGVSGALQQAVSTGFLRTMSVDPNYIIIGQGGRSLTVIKKRRYFNLVRRILIKNYRSHGNPKNFESLKSIRS